MQRFGHPDDRDVPNQHLVIVNNAIFVLRFVIQRLVDDRLISQTNSLGRLSTGRHRRIDLTTLRFHGERLQEGDSVRLRVGAIGGVRRNGPTMRFTPFFGQASYFEVIGMTTRFTIEHASSPRPSFM